jgi:integrase
MAKIRLKFVSADTDRHGNVRYYYRRRGSPKIRLPGAPGSPSFMAAYARAVAGVTSSTDTDAAGPAKKDSLRAYCVSYYSSAEFKRLDPRTQRVRRNLLDELCRKHGEKPTSHMEPRHVRRLRDEKADTPEAANALVKALRQVFAHAIANDMVKANPAREVPYIRSGSTGFHSWTPDEIVEFEHRHPIGSKARLALSLLLYTGQRRSDVVRFGRQHVRDGRICFTQHKNRARKPVSLQIPIVPDLQKIIDASPCGELTFLINDLGRPFTAAGFGNRFRVWCDEAGLKQCSAHGLRKAAASRLAELGASEHEIMAITGHRTSKEVTRYTRAARQKVLADRAMARLAAGQKGNESVPPEAPKPKSGTLIRGK